STKKEISIFQKIFEIKNKFGNNAIKNYLISNTEDFVNILEVMFLFLIANKKSTELSIVPLFESIKDLSNSNKIIEEFVTNECTKKFIKNVLKNRIEVLLGYSDSCKDGGNFASSWKIYNVQKKLTSLSKKHNIEISFFHGRGGTIGRGGGPSYYAINSQPKGSITRKLRFTEQGEIIWAKYSNPRKGWFNLETILTAAANAIINQKKNLLEDKAFFETMNFLSDLSAKKYHSLLNLKKFEKVFFDITPIKEISKLKIGSRPSSRSNKNNLKDLRSIPWVFSWSQVRAMVPGWYGVGSALDFYIKENEENLEKLRNWYQNIPFFHSLLSNIEMLLAKVNLDITKRYFETSKEKESENIFNDIYDEYNKVLNSILLIMDKEYLLQDYRDLKISLDDRIPYLNILNYFQLELISRKRKNKKSKLNDESILISINGIATGLR
ncbi:MAG: phosphoenolpyruvate carboxylase, partial [Malacoplasma sp.]|nr:phosphoenolpyruvate carboxylase [Malacoplasma sp.]